MTKKRTDYTDVVMVVSIILLLISYWVEIICGIVGDTNIVAPIAMFIYMISTSILMYKSMDIEEKYSILRVIGGSILSWVGLIIPYIIILAIKGIL